MKEDLTQKELKSRLNYDPLTGVFTWKNTLQVNAVKAGDTAGSIERGYIRIGIKGRQYKAHRLAWLYMTGQWPRDKVDHKDRIRYNNIWTNLQEADNQLNQKNAGKQHNNTSGVVGVQWHKKAEKWNARINVNGIQKHLGLFKNKHKAIAVRKAAEVMYEYSPGHGT